ncbi:efflux RND transporter periplasmic adaptor subunit [Draconibacterium orientale]|uniref:efflux RND transporter periplasmic adaptor subunit n=1 Tax=Draconibacterium orientale TaxID=1168034 RepID=UPI0029C02C5F|nr:efflux RND transporter periplasmic adaptor subunit [Draconibacterium orientale]
MLKKITYTVAILALIAFTVFKLKSNKEITEKRVYQYDKEKPISVQTMQVNSANSANTYTYTGTFEPHKETKLSADIQGKVSKVLVDLGSSVNKGETLIQLDNSLLKLQLQTIELQIEGLETDVKRFTILAAADAVQGVQLEKAELGLKTAKVQKATLDEQISKTTIRAPFNGIVTAKLTEEGAFAAPGMPLLQLTEISKLKFTVNVPENQLSQFSLQQVCKVSADVYPELAFEGKVSMVGSKANMGNSYPVQLELQNTPDLKIKSGMFGKVKVSTQGNENQISIPASAMVGTTIQPQVYVVKNGSAHLQNITIGERLEDKVIVQAGISEGDQIVINGFINLYDGAKVTFK